MLCVYYVCNELLMLILIKVNKYFMIRLSDVNELVSLVNECKLVCWNVSGCEDVLTMRYIVLYDGVNGNYFVYDTFKDIRLHTIINGDLVPLSSFVLSDYYIPYDYVDIEYIKNGFLSHCSVRLCSYRYFVCQRVKNKGVSYFISYVSKSFERTRVCQDIDYMLSMLSLFKGYPSLYGCEIYSSIKEFYENNDDGILDLRYDFRIK